MCEGVVRHMFKKITRCGMCVAKCFFFAFVFFLAVILVSQKTHMCHCMMVIWQTKMSRSEMSRLSDSRNQILLAFEIFSW